MATPSSPRSRRRIPALEIEAINTKGSTENVPMLEAGSARHRAGAGRGRARSPVRHRPAAGQPQGADGDVSDRRAVRGARRQSLPLDRRSQGQADRLGRRRLGPGDPRPLCDGRARPRCREGLPADLSRARGRRSGDGARRPRRRAVGRRRRLAGLQDGDVEPARAAASSRPVPTRSSAFSPSTRS